MRSRLLGIALLGCGLFYAAGASAQPRACGVIYDDLSALVARDECRKSSDCAIMQLPPPFGCNTYVNKEVVPEIESLAESYAQLCGPIVYQCRQPADHAHCRRGRCEGKVYLDKRAPNNGTLNRHGRPFRK